MVWAECAVRTAEETLKHKRQTLDALGTAPELPLEDGDWGSRLGEATAFAHEHTCGVIGGFVQAW